VNIAQQLDHTRGRATGFDYLRIVLACSVVAWHTILVCYGPAAEPPFWQSSIRPLIFVILPSFFALSGFLVAGSLVRVDNLPVFLTLRALRIFPALSCEVLISALILGPLLTVFSLHHYFADHQFRIYFFNIVGNIHFYLPGMFVNNPTDKVNQQLWTIPSELRCYVIIAILSFLTISKWPRLFIVVAVAFNIGFFCREWHSRGDALLGLTPSGGVLISCFLWGVALYLNRNYIYYSVWIFGIAALSAWLAITWRTGTVYPGVYLAPLPISYLTIYAGLQNPRKVGLIAMGDYSYGIYLYGFPIQQSIACLMPSYRVWYFNLITSLVVTSLLAWSSWTLIESRVLSGRQRAIGWVEFGCTFVVEKWRRQKIPARL